MCVLGVEVVAFRKCSAHVGHLTTLGVYLRREEGARDGSEYDRSEQGGAEGQEGA